MYIVQTKDSAAVQSTNSPEEAARLFFEASEGLEPILKSIDKGKVSVLGRVAKASVKGADGKYADEYRKEISGIDKAVREAYFFHAVRSANGLENSVEQDAAPGREATRSSMQLRQFGNEAEKAGQEINRLDSLANSQEASARLGTPKGMDGDYAPVEQTERDIARQAEAMARVHAEFVAFDSNKLLSNERSYHYRDSGQLAFRDYGNKIKTHVNDERVALGIVNLAESRGWKSIKVNGQQDFRRQVWLEASLKNISVRGYTPTEQDKARLASVRERQMRNSVEATAPKAAQRQQVGMAVADKIMTAKIKDASVREQALSKINGGLQARAEKGTVPAIPIYDKNAPPGATHQQQRGRAHQLQHEHEATR
ncbi:MAG: hypothetical protein LBG78_07150 [Azoarcus sp.]|jgi:hypothetical protein|nr:hypothetical protein [Azoarcus sp.]